MATLPEKTQQIIQSHSFLILQVVQACHNRDLVPELEPILQTAAANGWVDLVDVIHKILGGSRDTALLAKLDEEDTVIAEAILRGLQDPTTLPDPSQSAQAGMAAPGLAQLIHAARTGDVMALQMIADMAEQMTRTAGDMAYLGAAVSRMVDGVREEEILCKNLTSRGEKLVLDILAELAKLDAH